VVLGCDLVAAITDETITAGGATVTHIGHTAVDVSLGLSWRSDWHSHR